MWAARHFQSYLNGIMFTLRTDHHFLQWLHNFKGPEGQVACWLEVLLEYDYYVVHREGMMLMHYPVAGTSSAD